MAALIQHHPMNDAQATTWNGVPLRITCRLVPRWAFTTASIDVYLDDRPTLRTGGVFKIVGSQVEQFEFAGERHELSVSWGKASPRHFPVTVSVDGIALANRKVPIENWYMGYWPWLLLAAAVAWATSRH